MQFVVMHLKFAEAKYYDLKNLTKKQYQKNIAKN